MSVARIFGTLTAAALLLITSACEVDEIEVAYLSIPGVAVTPRGTLEPDGIAALRVVRGDTSLGFYPIPADVPLLGLGTATLSIEPAVRRSGLSEELLVYPLYQPVAQTLGLVPGQTDTIRPIFSYRPEAVVALDEGFESSSSILIRDLAAEGSAPLTRVTDGVRAGTGSGLITLSAATPVYEVASAVVRPDRASILDLWVELDYRGEGVLALALFPEAPTLAGPGEPLSARYFQGALPREEWTKFYFDIVDDSNRGFLADGFRVSLLAIYNEDLGAEQRLYLDNLRVVYR